MKILIVFTEGLLSLNEDDSPKSNIVEELLGIYLALEKAGHTPYLLIPEGSSKRYRYVGLDADVNQFDQLILSRDTPNFIGGAVTRGQWNTVSLLTRYHGQVCSFFCDPDMAPGNYLRSAEKNLYSRSPGSLIFNGGKLTADILSTAFPRDEMLKAAERLDESICYTTYPVFDHPIHRKVGKPLHFIDSWREHLFNVRPKVPRELVPGYSLGSLCYIGSNKPSRHKRLVELGLFSSEAEDAGIIKYYGKVATFRKTGEKASRIKVADVPLIYRRHVAGLVVSHKDQYGTGINHRFIQSLTLGKPFLIDHLVDEKRSFMDNGYLNEVLYFKDRKDLADKLEYLRDMDNYEKICALVEEQAEIYKNRTVEELVKRANA